MAETIRIEWRRSLRLANLSLILLAAIAGFVLVAGCRRSEVLSSQHTGLKTAIDTTPAPTSEPTRQNTLSRAERSLKDATAMLAANNANATGKFLDATTLAWQAVCEAANDRDTQHDRASVVYHDSLQQLIESAQQFGQLDSRHGLVVETATSKVRVPVRYHGFAWQPEDFNQWIPVTDYEGKHLVTKHQRIGWGVPLVILRHRNGTERFMTKSQPFAATALLRPVSDRRLDSGKFQAPYMLEVFNPMAIKAIAKDDGQSTPLAADVSAPIAWLSQNCPHLNFQAFLHPDRIRSSGQLIMHEPYQPGKIPVIFVHGLLSDPLTWNGLINELRADDWFNERYQVWTFGYSTGRPFLRSAADMRRECSEAIAAFANDNPDPALNRTVLIGHSMGGLVSKLLITDSQNQMWGSFAGRPLESLATDQATHRYLSELFYFRPLPFVERAVFIGTPHGGSPIADEWIGRLGSHLVSRSHEFSDEYELFLKQNRGSIHPFFAKHLPTSIDMLEPEDPILNTMRRLPVSPRIRLHSIIGNGHTMLVGGPADGAVPITSARHEDVDSEIIVPATHRHLQAHPDTVEEIRRILTLHLEQGSLASTGPPTPYH